MNDHVSTVNAADRSPKDIHLKAATDLLCRISDLSPLDIAEVGCGPWSIKALLGKYFPEAKIVPLELSQLDVGSPEPSSKAISRKAPDDVSPGAAAEFDLIYSNGGLEMLPRLRQLLRKLLRRVRAGGALAVQVPNNLYEPNRAVMRMVASEGPWAKKLLPIAKTRPFNETLEDLYVHLVPHCASVDVWPTTDLHPLDGVASIVELMKATTLAPFLKPIDEKSRKAFLDRYAYELTRSYPAQPDGKVLLRFPTISVVARR